MIARLEHAARAELFGGKAVQLRTAIAAGLPVPSGVALSWREVQLFAHEPGRLRSWSEQLVRLLQPPLAVRSSAVGEDSAAASFAGQHRTHLGVFTASELSAAIASVRDSAFIPAALAYRQRLGIAGPPRMGVVVQQLIQPVCAGVMFTLNPVTGAAERVIEAAWGLGEAVVAGVVTPDRYRLDATGAVIEQQPGEKDLAFRFAEGGVREEEVAPELVHRLCLDVRSLAALHRLATRCEQVLGPELDIEWAWDGSAIHLLQHRPITHSIAA
jgi:pyruvate, water dikinase